MATTTPNFGWPVPTSTDLVKDGATAIEALGDGIDTSLVDLKGGTTGQILAKATSADMDFAWITNDVGDITAITASSPLTGGGTSGDVTVGILDATTSNKGAVQLSTSTSSTSTTLAATASAVKSAYDLANSAPIANPILNSAQAIWQRGTSISIAASTSVYTADRWPVSTTANAATTVSQQATGDTTNLAFIQYCSRIQRNSGQTGTTGQFMYQSLESINSIPFAGKTVTASFYIRAGATFLSSGAAVTAKLWSGTGTDQNLLSGFTGQAQVAAVTPTVTATWQRVTVSGTVGATATQLAFGLDMGAVGTAGATDFIETTGWQIDIGSVALPFRTNQPTIATELAACQRYYWRENLSTFVGSATNGFSTTTTNFTLATRNPVAMRVGATAVDFSTLRIVDTSNSAYAITNVTLLSSQPQKILSTEVNATISGGTAGRWGYLQGNGTGYLGFSAEL